LPAVPYHSQPHRRCASRACRAACDLDFVRSLAALLVNARSVANGWAAAKTTFNQVERLMTIHCRRNIPTCLAAATLLIWGTLQAQSEVFFIESESASFDLMIPDPNINFQITFNQAPNFFTVDAFDREENDFQYATPDSIIRGPEIYITRNKIRIRSLGPPDPDPASGGWGPVIATIPFNLSGDTITFSAPFDLFSNSPFFTYQLQADTFGRDRDLIQGHTTSIPEPSIWAMMLLGFAGLGLVGCRRARETRAAI
jgi:hypothetical protein